VRRQPGKSGTTPWLGSLSRPLERVQTSRDRAFCACYSPLELSFLRLQDRARVCVFKAWGSLHWQQVRPFRNPCVQSLRISGLDDRKSAAAHSVPATDQLYARRRHSACFQERPAAVVNVACGKVQLTIYFINFCPYFPGIFILIPAIEYSKSNPVKTDSTRREPLDESSPTRTEPPDGPATRLVALRKRSFTQDSTPPACASGQVPDTATLQARIVARIVTLRPQRWLYQSGSCTARIERCGRRTSARMISLSAVAALHALKAESVGESFKSDAMESASS
jgi:hypothetical protein